MFNKTLNNNKVYFLISLFLLFTNNSFSQDCDIMSLSYIKEKLINFNKISEDICDQNTPICKENKLNMIVCLRNKFIKGAKIDFILTDEVKKDLEFLTNDIDGNKKIKEDFYKTIEKKSKEFKETSKNIIYEKLGGIDKEIEYFEKTKKQEHLYNAEIENNIVCNLIDVAFWDLKWRCKLNSGLIYFKKGDYPNAIVLLKAAKDSKPKYAYEIKFEAKVYFMLGQSYYNNLEHEQALKTCSQFIKNTNQKWANFHNLCGLANQKLGNYQAAVDNFKEAINLNSTLIDVYINLGKVYVEFQKYDDAVNTFGKVIDYYEKLKLKEPTNEDITSNLGISYGRRGEAYIKNGEKDKAKADFDKFYELARIQTPKIQ